MSSLVERVLSESTENLKGSAPPPPPPQEYKKNKDRTKNIFLLCTLKLYIYMEQKKTADKQRFF